MKWKAKNAIHLHYPTHNVLYIARWKRWKVRHNEYCGTNHDIQSVVRGIANVSQPKPRGHTSHVPFLFGLLQRHVVNKIVWIAGTWIFNTYLFIYIFIRGKVDQLKAHARHSLCHIMGFYTFSAAIVSSKCMTNIHLSYWPKRPLILFW